MRRRILEKRGIQLVEFARERCLKAKEQAIDIALEGTNAKSVNGQILTAKNVADFNDFDHPDRVKVADFKQAKLKKNVLSVKIPAKSLVVMTLK